MKRCSTSLNIRGIQIKTKDVVSPHTSQNDHHQKNLQTINAGEDMDKREPFYTVDGNVGWYSRYGQQYGGSLQNLK